LRYSFYFRLLLLEMVFHMPSRFRICKFLNRRTAY
jgi:hypothetical protein